MPENGAGQAFALSMRRAMVAMDGALFRRPGRGRYPAACQTTAMPAIIFHAKNFSMDIPAGAAHRPYGVLHKWRNIDHRTCNSNKCTCGKSVFLLEQVYILLDGCQAIERQIEHIQRCLHRIVPGIPGRDRGIVLL